MWKRLALVVVLAALSAGAQQNPPSPPAHEPKRCTRPDVPIKGHVACGTCKLVCEDGKRVEDKSCAAYCRHEWCRCHADPCCEEGEGW